MFNFSLVREIFFGVSVGIFGCLVISKYLWCNGKLLVCVWVDRIVFNIIFGLFYWW